MRRMILLRHVARAWIWQYYLTQTSKGNMNVTIVKSIVMHIQYMQPKFFPKGPEMPLVTYIYM